jgi:DNA polymerase I-like protein with 3'-5' exonuclease and polymerase domains
MIEVHTKIRFGCTQLPAGACRMVLQIHDEFLFEVGARYVASAQPVIRECMDKVAVNLNVPLSVKIQVGTSWGGLKEV